jgi:hypothetical protein
MVCRHQRNAPADNVALWVKLGIRQFGQAMLQFVPAHLERSLECSRYYWFPTCDLLDNLDAKVFLLALQLLRQAFSDCFERWMLHRFPSFLLSKRILQGRELRCSRESMGANTAQAIWSCRQSSQLEKASISHPA